MKIVEDDLTGVEIALLLQQHIDDMALHSPAESTHALDLKALRQPDITFWTAWEKNELLGCGALKEHDALFGEIKSMRTAQHHQRKGVAENILRHIISIAKARGYGRLSLETGSAAVFVPAQSLYRKFGFDECAPFADYVTDPYSLFMTREI